MKMSSTSSRGTSSTAFPRSPPRRGHEGRPREGGRFPELDPPLPRPLAGQRGAQEPDRPAHARQGLLERDPVPALDDHVRRRADAEAEASSARLLQRGRVLGENGGPPAGGGYLTPPAPPSAARPRPGDDMGADGGAPRRPHPRRGGAARGCRGPP